MSNKNGLFALYLILIAAFIVSISGCAAFTEPLTTGDHDYDNAAIAASKAHDIFYDAEQAGKNPDCKDYAIFAQQEYRPGKFHVVGVRGSREYHAVFVTKSGYVLDMNGSAVYSFSDIYTGRGYYELLPFDKHNAERQLNRYIKDSNNG
ncbi:hypothetical protein [Candidatus Venteria ishoeyi]|uniref:Uncharacterized protein n=1 Tax=Candidatus Venteria ishoeyi TaxID=1899563 RepID=A0A1H6F5U9_9GAMM|nr:hypothetical protein [Candidatus Venteria ishoeyi]SEH05482.1 Uncharacterised protein [Candidatus Venteria ishoeyi]